MSNLKTRWTDKVNYDCPLSEYPRPQLVRNDWQCLNGKYEFTITGMTDDIPQRERLNPRIIFGIVKSLYSTTALRGNAVFFILRPLTGAVLFISTASLSERIRADIFPSALT